MKKLLALVICLGWSLTTISGEREGGGGNTLALRFEEARGKAKQMLEVISTEQIQNEEIKFFLNHHKSFLINELKSSPIIIADEAEVFEMVNGEKRFTQAKTAFTTLAPIFISLQKNINVLNSDEHAALLLHEVIHHTGLDHENWEQMRFFDQTVMTVKALYEDVLKKAYSKLPLFQVAGQSKIRLASSLLIPAGSNWIYFQNKQVHYSYEDLNHHENYCYFYMKVGREANVLLPEMSELTINRVTANRPDLTVRMEFVGNLGLQLICKSNTSFTFLTVEQFVNISERQLSMIFTPPVVPGL